MSIYYERIKSLMDKHGLTPSELSRAVPSATTSCIYKWGKDIANPSTATLCEIADYFDVSMDFLCGRITPPPEPELREDEIEVLRIYREIDVERKATFLSDVYRLHDEYTAPDSLSQLLLKRSFDTILEAKEVINETGKNFQPYAWVNEVSQKGVVRAISDLLREKSFRYGFLTLWTEKRLDLTQEYLATLPEFAALFSDEDRQIAHQKLKDVGFFDE